MVVVVISFLSSCVQATFLTSVILSSFSHFDLDENNAPGLFAKIKQARLDFPSDSGCEGIETEGVVFVQLGLIVRNLAKRAFSLDLTTILVSGYVQDVSALVLQDPHVVDPFLRWMVKKE